MEVSNSRCVDVPSHSRTRFPPPVLVPVCHDHHRGVSSEDHAIVPSQAQTLIRGRSKSDALFSYHPPFNLVAFLVLWPLSCVLSPRKLHSANVFMIKLTVSVLDNFPFDPSKLTSSRSFDIQFNSDGRSLSCTMTELEIVLPDTRGDWALRKRVLGKATYGREPGGDKLIL